MRVQKSIHKYSGILASPLKPGEASEDKLPALMLDLGAKTYSEAILAFLNRHIIGRDLRKYPVEIRGSIKNYGEPTSRFPVLYKLFKTTDDRVVLVELAKAHVPGFKGRSFDRPKGGRTAKHSLIEKAMLVEWMDATSINYRLPGGRKPTLKDIAKLAAKGPDADSEFRIGGLSGISPETLINYHNKQKRDDQLFLKQEAANTRKLRKILGMD